MSLNFIESVIDKLFFPLKGNEELFTKKFIGSQNLMEANSNLNHNLLSEIHQLLKSDCLPPDPSAMNRLFSGVISNMHYFESPDNKLVNRVSKLLSPSISNLLQDSFRILSNQSEFLFDLESNHSSCEALHPRNFLGTYNFIGDEVATKMAFSALSLCTTEYFNCEKNESGVVNDCPSTLLSQEAELKSQKPKIICSQNLNQELVNRKAKELHKRSKKRRRRQKKINLVEAKKMSATSESSEMSKFEDRETSRLCASPSGSPGPDCLKSDILCEKITMKETSSMQIFLPDISPFFISVENTGDDDDTEWDACSDSEWLTSCSEFEVSGLFVANLTSSITNTSISNGYLSQLNVPSLVHFDEVQKFNSALYNVNKIWNESTKDFDKKPKLATKVTFAPDEELVKILPVEMYERKGEWEIYALERFRFKKRIDEAEKILSPCLSKKHRAKMFYKLHQIHL